MSYVLEIKLEGLPKRTNNNSRTHWRAQMAEARKWKKAVIIAALQFKPTSPLNRAVLSLTRVSSVEPDFDGLVSSFKNCIDGLIEAGIIANDKMSNIGIPTYKWTKGKPRHGYVVIRVEANPETGESSEEKVSG